MKKILIAVPCMNQVPAEFAQSISQIKKVDQCAVVFQIGTLVYIARDKLAEIAVECEADYILWLDSDMVFDPDILVRMLDVIQNTDIDILSGLYFRRVEPYTPTIFEHLELEGDVIEWKEFTHVPAKPFEIAGCGFGCVLMPTEIIKAVKSAYNALFTPFNSVGEDLAFCWRARQLGYHLYCDPRITLGHVGYTLVTKEYFLAHQERGNTDDKDV